MFTLPFYFESEQMPFLAISLIVGLVILVWIYTRPQEHFIKRLMWYMVIDRAEAYAQLFGQRIRPNYRHTPLMGRIFFWLLVTPLTAGFLLSIAVLLGIASSAPPPASPPTPVFDSSKFEIVTDGHVIYARPRTPAPTTKPISP